MSTRARRIGVPGLVVAAMAFLATACVTDLTADLGEHVSVGGINDAGMMVGSDHRVDSEPVRWNPDKSRVSLARVPGSTTLPFGVDNAGEVWGFAFEKSGPRAFEEYAVVWDEDGDMTDLRPFIAGAGQPGVHAGAADMNQRGVVAGTVGAYSTVNPPPAVTAGVWVVDTNAKDRTATVIPAFNPHVRAINDDGVIVGSANWYYVDGVPTVDWGRWIKRDGTYVFEKLEGFEPYDINNRGDMVGNAGGLPAVWKVGDPAPTPLATAGVSTAGFVPDGGHINDNRFVVMSLWNHEPGADNPLSIRWKTLDTTTPEPFPTDGWKEGSFHDLNNHGVAVGSATKTGDTLLRAIRWE